jgi:hypothetical protein
MKEEHFLEKVKEMLLEEDRLRVPVAQGLLLTTDELEVYLFLFIYFLDQ